MSSFRLKLILVPSVLALAVPAWAGTRQPPAKAAPARPLNLSLPRDMLQAPATATVDETVQRNLRAPQPVESPPPPARLRYGTGYEQRMQDMGGGAVGGGSPGAGAGAGRRGR